MLSLPMRQFVWGPPTSKDSYLKIANIISAAEITTDAIHPGYGFLF